MAEEKPKASPLGAIKIVLQILVGLVFFITVITNCATVYIVFAPDDLFPAPFNKPFRIQYLYDDEPAPVTTSGSHSTAPTAKPASGTTTEAGAPGTGITIDTGTKIVNLTDPGGRKFIRANVVVEFATDPKYKTMSETEKKTYLTTFNEEVKSKLPIINDTIISVLSTKDFAAIYTAEGKDKLRKEMLDALKAKVHEPAIIAIYFTEFVMQ